MVYSFLIKRMDGKPNFSDRFKKIIKRYNTVGYNTVCMPGCKPNRHLQLWFPI